MADSVRVRTEWLPGDECRVVNPDDLARAIREVIAQDRAQFGRAMAAEIALLCEDIFKVARQDGTDVFAVTTALRWMAERLGAAHPPAAPREPAQERQDGAPRAEPLRDPVRDVSDVPSLHGVVREHFMPVGGADPLLPGLQYVREHYHASPGIMAWLDAEIARREGA